MRFPCKNCEEREIGCHGYCEKYIKAKAESDAAIQARVKVFTAEAYRKSVLIKNRDKRVKKAMGR